MEDLLHFMKQYGMVMKTTTETPTTTSPFELEEICGHSLKNDTFVKNTRFYVSGISVGATACLGFLGNLISLITLGSMSKRGIFIKLLLTLTTFDILFLLYGGIFMLQQAFNFQNNVYNALFPRFIYPMAGISMTGMYSKEKHYFSLYT